MTTYHDRDEWTSTDASGVELTGAELVGVAVHWPGTSQEEIGVESKAGTASRLRGYRNFHVTGRGWRDIGYNVAIDQAGRAWMLRSTAWGVNMVGAHCASSSNPRANHKYVGVLLIVGADEAPSPAMREAFADWYHKRFLPRWTMRTDVRGHGQVAGAETECPGSLVRADIADGDLTRITEDDDMTPEQARKLDEVHATLTDPIPLPDGRAEQTPLSMLKWSHINSDRAVDRLVRVLANQQVIMQAQGVEVDEAALAQQIAAIVVPAVVDEFGIEIGDEVESRIRRVLGALDEAT